MGGRTAGGLITAELRMGGMTTGELTVNEMVSGSGLPIVSLGRGSPRWTGGGRNAAEFDQCGTRVASSGSELSPEVPSDVGIEVDVDDSLGSV